MEFEVERKYSQTQSKQKSRMTPEMVAKLKEEAAKTPAFSSLCHVLALRERSRSQLTLRNLNIVMQREGFNYDSEQNKQSLLFLASIGVGVIDRDLKGNVRSLKNIRVMLQNVGLAALSKVKTETPKILIPEIKPQPTTSKTPVVVTIFGRSITIEMTTEEAAGFLIKILQGGPK